MLTLLVLALVLAPIARAGGDFVDLARHGSRLWFAGEFGVREIDAGTGRTLAAPRLNGATYPVSVAVAGGATWVASVQNGYTAGKLTRIDARTGRQRVVLRAVVEYVATGAGGVWLPLANSVLRVDERTGRVRTFHTGMLRPGGFQHDLAVGDGALWLLQQDTRDRSFLVRRSLATGHITGVAALPGIADAVVATPEGVWVGVAPSTLERFDPRTLRRTARLDVS